MAMDSVVLPSLSAPAPKRKKPNKIKYGHAVIKKLLENLPDNTPQGTVVLGGPDNLPVLLKQRTPWVIHFDSKTADGGVLYYPWPQITNAAIEEDLQKKLFDIRTDAPLAALNYVRFFKTQRILRVGAPGKAAKKWVENSITPIQDGENAGKAMIDGKLRVPGTSVSGHYGDYPKWILEEYQAKYPESQTKRRKKSQQTPPPLLPTSVAAPQHPLSPIPAPSLPAAPFSPPRLGAEVPSNVPSPAISLTGSLTGSLWDDDIDMDVLDAAVLSMDLTAERKAICRRIVNGMTKKQITGVLNRQCKLKWHDKDKDISADFMKDSFVDVLFSPSTLYDIFAPMHGLVSRKEVVYKVPMDVIKTEVNKLLRKAGEETIM